MEAVTWRLCKADLAGRIHSSTGPEKLLKKVKGIEAGYLEVFLSQMYPQRHPTCVSKGLEPRVDSVMVASSLRFSISSMISSLISEFRAELVVLGFSASLWSALLVLMV